jgi:hypothetical protein
MTRDEKVAIVESFLDCLIRKALDQIPTGEGLTVESAMTLKSSGRAAMEYAERVAAGFWARAAFSSKGGQLWHAG